MNMKKKHKFLILVYLQNFSQFDNFMQNTVIMASESNYPVSIITEIINFLLELKMTSCEIGIF